MNKRNPDEILLSPKIGDTIRGSFLGLKSRHTLVYSECPICKNTRWVCNTEMERNRRCKKCYLKSQRGRKQPKIIIKTIKLNETPKQGDLIKGSEIGKKYSYAQWAICEDCGKGRWMYKGQVNIYKRCKECGKKIKKIYTGKEHHMWKGGVLRNRKGYVYILLNKDDPYYKMANHIGYVPEHRYVMANHLKRCLKRTEVVHHINNIKNDNRIENLLLIESKLAHTAITTLETDNKRFKKRIEILERKIKLDEWRIKELEKSLRENDLLFGGKDERA